jgi:WD40 repeat protein
MSERSAFAGLLLLCLTLASAGPGRTDTPPVPDKEDSGKAAPARTDRYGDPLPLGAIARLGSVRLRQPDCDVITCVAFSADGKWLASAGAVSQWEGSVGEKPYRIRLWDPASGRELRRLGGFAIAIDHLAFTPDSKLLASANHERIRMWDPATGRLVREIKVSTWAQHLAFSPDSKFLAGAWGRSDGLSVLELATGKTVWHIGGRAWSAKAVAFSSDGTLLAAAALDGTVSIWDRATRKIVRQLAQPEARSVTFLRGGKEFAACGDDDREISVWSVQSGKVLHQLRRRKEGACIGSNLAASPNCEILAWAEGGALFAWEPATDPRQRLVAQSDAHVLAVAFSADGGVLATGDVCGTVRLWDRLTGKERLPYAAHRHNVLSVDYSPDGKVLASGSADGTVRFWEPISGKPLQVFQRLPDTVRCLRFSPDGKVLGGACAEQPVRLWDVASGKEVLRFTGPGAVAGMLTFSPDGKSLATASTGGPVCLWDSASGKQIRALPVRAKDGQLVGCAFSPDGQILAVGSGKPAVGLWSVGTGKKLGELRCSREYRVDSVVFSPDGKTLAGTGHDGAAYVWVLASRTEVPQFNRRTHEWDDDFGGQVVAFSRDGSALAVASVSMPVGVWDVASGGHVHTFNTLTGGTHDEVYALAFSPDGRTFASAGAGHYDILVWDLTGLLRNGALPRVPVSAKEVATLWTDLASSDARVADRAVWRLAATPEQAVALLQEYLRPVSPADRGKIASWILDLDAKEFRARERAEQSLRALGELAEQSLRKALDSGPSLETRHRLQRLLARLEPTAPRRLQIVRAVKALEQHGTPAARTLLRRLAGGTPGAWLTQASLAALQRLSKRPAE